MNRIQILTGAFDAACFLLAHLNLFDEQDFDLNVVRKALRKLIEQSAQAKIVEVEKELGFRDEKGNLKVDFENLKTE